MVDRLVNSEMNTKRIAHMEACFGMSGVRLNVPGRVLVGEGVLTKICRKKPKSRQFFLFNDILVYGTIVIAKKKYAQQHLIPLEGLTLEDLLDEAEHKNGWLIKTPTKSFAVYAGSRTEKAEWMGHIRKCVNDLLKHSGKTAIQEHAAVWVPDSGARVCMHCKNTQFTILNRRHHCRSCGAVICGNCSKNRLVILHQSNKPVRVCDTCYDQKNDHLNRFRDNAERTSITSTASSIPAVSPELVGDDSQVVDKLAALQTAEISEKIQDSLKINLVENSPTKEIVSENRIENDNHCNEESINQSVELKNTEDHESEDATSDDSDDEVEMNVSADESLADINRTTFYEELCSNLQLEDFDELKKESTKENIEESEKNLTQNLDDMNQENSSNEENQKIKKEEDLKERPVDVPDDLLKPQETPETSHNLNQNAGLIKEPALVA